MQSGVGPRGANYCDPVANWVMAVEQPDPDPAGREVPDDAVVHAYDTDTDTDAGAVAHSITRSYLVKEDLAVDRASSSQPLPQVQAP